jgi:non-specific serine/threonine protein kinase
LASAAFVCAAAEPAVLEGIGSLVGKSLMRYEGDAGGAPRYGMLETIREFGLDQLAASGREADVRARHADWCLAFAKRVGPQAKDVEAATSLEALEREHPNLRAALAWLEDQGDGPRLLLLAGALWSFWHEHAHYGEGRRWLEAALARGREAPAADRLRAMVGASTMAWYQTDIPAARQWNERALALAREVGDRKIEALSLSNLGAQAAESGDLDRAVANFEAGLALARAVGDGNATVAALHNLACATWLRGELALAVERHAEGLALAREHGVSWLVPALLNGIGFATADQGDHRRAIAAFQEALTLGQARGNLGDVIDSLEGLAMVGAELGESGRAVRMLAAADALRAEIAKAHVPTESAYFAPILNDLRQALGVKRFRAAWAEGRTVAQQEAIAEALTVGAVEAGDAAPHGLTQRELEVLHLVAAGQSNREIGEALFISRTTAARHVANIFNKLNVGSRAEATAFAQERGLA